MAFAALAAHLPVPAVVVRSSLSRTRHTLEALIAAGWTEVAERLIVVEPAFTEQAFGAWEGVAWDQAASDPCYKTFWLYPFTVRPPGGGESFVDVMTRVRAAVRRLSSEYAGRDIVAVAHAGPIRAALALALNLTPEQVHAIAVDPLSVTCLEQRGTTWQVRRINTGYP